MPQGIFNDESFLFLQIGTLCQGSPLTCPPDTTVVDAARLMRRDNSSGIIVVDHDKPQGVVSLSDLRNLVDEMAGNVTGRQVSSVMSSGLITARAHELVVEAIFRMAKYNIHRLVVIDDDGSLRGVITDTDLLRLQTRTPLYLNQEIESAASFAQLARINARMVEMVRFAVRAGTDIRSLVELISHLNDAFTNRVIVMLEEEGVRLPAGAALLVLGSEGRGEQTLRTDQDSAVIHADDFPEERQAELARFSSRLVEALEQIGVPRCPGDTMASNPQWRHSLRGWKELLGQWISVPKSEHMVNFGMFQDFRTIHGDPELEAQLRRHLLSYVERQAVFFPYMARHITRFPPPVGFFGHIRVERRGEHRGEIDLKKAGIFAITETASLLALEQGLTGGSTWEKLEQLRQKGILPEEDANTVIAAYSYLVQLRLQRQLKAIAAGASPSNHLNPLAIPDIERDQLRQALKGVSTCLRIISSRFSLNAIAR